MDRFYPLRFQPVLRRYLWGGRRLETVLHKSIGDGDDYAESWEIVDHGDDVSVIANGTYQGTSLRQFTRQHAVALYGCHEPRVTFPLLFKFLDAQRTLSVQVHPNDAQAARLDPPDLGKTEAWVILDVQPGSKVYAGIKRGFDRHAFEREVARGTCELCLHRFEPQPGDCIFVPAGTVHALGEGLLVAEIQQASDTTFRLFDFNRVDAQGQRRPLHVQEALDVIDFELGPVDPVQPQSTVHEHVQRLVACDKFVLDRWVFSSATEIGGDERMHLVAVLEGNLTVDAAFQEEPLAKGSTLLLPAAAGAIRLTPSGSVTLLDIYLP